MQKLGPDVSVVKSNRNFVNALHVFIIVFVNQTLKYTVPCIQRFNAGNSIHYIL